jgi:gliding motility-associated-like protein
MEKCIYKNALGAILLVAASTGAFARSGHPAKGPRFLEPVNKGIDFVENKGQWEQAARFKAAVPGGVMFLTDQGFVYNYADQKQLQHRHEDDHGNANGSQEELLNCHAYNVNFVGARADLRYEPAERRSYYHNYFLGNDPSRWAGNVGLYGTVKQQGVYEGIDLVVYSKEQNLKYDFIVAPGANPAQIQLAFEGVQPQLRQDGSLHIRTSVNEIHELAPYTYQLIDGKEVPVASRYELSKGVLRFAFPEGYNQQYPLVIDPVLVFATFSGGVASGGSSGYYAYSTTYDEEGNTYASSGAYHLGWPTTAGAYQTTFAGVRDVSVNKYNATGSALIYSTYYGGSNQEFPNAMKVNADNELVIIGGTNSNNIPVTGGCYDNSLDGPSDIFVAHFNATGTALIGATYLGGSGSEFRGFGSQTNIESFFDFSANNNGVLSPMELDFDTEGNIWVAGNSNSTDIDIVGGGAQNSYTVKKWICNGTSYTFGTQVLTSSGVYTQTFSSPGACDSMVTLHLEVGAPMADTIVANICPGEGYTFGTTVLTSSGVYNQTFVSAYGCDSSVQLVLTALPYKTNAVAATICPGSSYLFGVNQLTDAGIYIDTFATSGCDSIVTLTLDIAPYQYDTLSATMCGGAYYFGTQLLTMPGIYTDTFVSLQGCQVITTLQLSNGADATYSTAARMCEGSVYTFGSQTLTQAGVYTERFAGANCDSVVTLTLSVQQYSLDTIQVTICQGTGYPFGDDTLMTAGYFTHTFESSLGCDSTVTVLLNFTPYIVSYISDSVCYGGSYVFNNQVLTTAGTYIDIFPTAGCDSVVTLTLTIIPRDTFTFVENYCTGSNYYFAGTAITSPGVYYHNFVSASGCDSVVKLVLTGPWTNSNSLSGGFDVVLFKLNPDCSDLLFSSYLGGQGDEAPTGMLFNSAGQLIISGLTRSNDFPTTPGTLHPTAPGGNFDGFVTIIDPVYGNLISGTYLGTPASDMAVSVQVDDHDTIYVLGRTMGAYPISAGVWTGDANGDLFIQKMDPLLTESLLTTRLGNPQSNSTRYFPSAFLVDICRNVYVAGYYAGTGLPLSGDAQQTTPASFWFGVLTPDFGGLFYGSYFGVSGDHGHCGVSRMDPNGIVYHSICCSSLTYPGTTGSSYAQNKSAGISQDVVSFKFNFEATGVQSNFQLSPGQNDTGCVPYTVQMVNNSSAAINYLWDFGDGSAPVTASDPTHTFTAPGTYTVRLYANNPNTCITDDTASMEITILETAMPDIVVRDTVLCANLTSLDISVVINNPSPNNSIEWGPAAGILTASNLADVSVNPSLFDQFWVTVKDTIPGICGFSRTDTVHIDLAPRVLNVFNNDTVVCEGAVIQIEAEGTPAYSYHWSPATGVSDTNALEPTITVTEPVMYTLVGKYKDCPDTTIFLNIDMHYMPQLEMTANMSVCQGTELSLNANVAPFRNDYQYQWSPVTPGMSNPNSPSIDLVADTSITYFLDVRTPIGCSDKDSVRLTVYPGDFGSISSDTGYCPGNAVQLWAAGGNVYTWSPAYGLNTTDEAEVVASPLTTTSYSVLIRDQHDCLDTQYVTVEVYPDAIFEMPDSIEIFSGERYHLEPGTNANYFKWFPPSGISDVDVSDPYLYPIVRTRYFVTATTVHGCTLLDSIDVLVRETQIDMPNAFAPGGANPVFKPSRRGIAQLKRFEIFNRWGNKVFSTTDINQGWDGTYNGTPQPMGVYVYVIEAVSDTGAVFTQDGNVTLVR